VYDAVVGDVTILAERLENATFTQPFLPSALSRVVQLKPNRTPWMLTKPFTSPVWFLIAVALLYNCFCIWYFEHRRNPEFDGPWWNQLGAALWLIITSIFFASGENCSFNKFCRKILAHYHHYYFLIGKTVGFFPFQNSMFLGKR